VINSNISYLINKWQGNIIYTVCYLLHQFTDMPYSRTTCLLSCWSHLLKCWRLRSSHRHSKWNCAMCKLTVSCGERGVFIEKYPKQNDIALGFCALMGRSYVCESSFSVVNHIKSKTRSRLDSQMLSACIRLALTETQSVTDPWGRWGRLSPVRGP